MLTINGRNLKKVPEIHDFQKPLNTVTLLFTILHKHKINLLVMQQLKT